jgi:replicative DNA helicase
MCFSAEWLSVEVHVRRSILTKWLSGIFKKAENQTMAASKDTLGFKTTLPPQNLEAEMSVIGSVCLQREAFDEVTDLKPEHFYADRHQRIWEALTELHRDNIGIDAVTMAEKLDSQKLLSEIGNVEYIGQLLESVPNAAHVRYYANIVISRWRMRQAVYGCS